MVGADTTDDNLVDAVPGFHYRSAGSGVLAVALDAHGCGQTGAVAIQIKFPPPMVTPISILVTPMPYPIFLPPRTPNTPACRAFHRPIGDRRTGKAVVAVIRYGIGRRVLIKVNDFHVESRFRCAAGARYRHLNSHVLLGIRGSPFHPRKLAVAFGVINIAYAVGLTADIEADAGGAVGIGLSAADSHCCDDVGVDPVLIIVGFNLRRLRLFLKADDAKPKAGLDIRIGRGAGLAASPCGIAEVTHLQKHGKGQIFVSEGYHAPP